MNQQEKNRRILAVIEIIYDECADGTDFRFDRDRLAVILEQFVNDILIAK